MSCPICQRPVDPAFRPFCSKRCADLDLSRWLTGAYRVPAEAAEEGETLREDPSDAPPKPH